MDTRTGEVNSLEAFGRRYGKTELQRLRKQGVIVPTEGTELSPGEEERLERGEQPVVRQDDEDSKLRDRLDPVVKTGGEGQPIRLSEMGWNRKERRAYLKAIRRGRDGIDAVMNIKEKL